MDRERRDVLDELSSLVETLTTSGSEKLDQDLLKQLKNICKSSDENVHHLYRLVMSQLEKQHAEIRLSSLQVINEIFTRSHAFRVLVTDNLQELFALTLATDVNRPLPEPSAVAKVLKNQSFQAIEKWHEKFGLYYKKLALGYKYLKNVKKIRFESQQVNTAVERRRRDADNARQVNQTEQKLTRILNEMGEKVDEIRHTIIEMGNCFKLIMPSPDNFDIYKGLTDNQDDSSDQPSTSKAYHEPPSIQKGHKRSENITVAVNKTVLINESKDNADILSTLREQYKQITSKFLPLVQKWLDVLTKHAGQHENLVQAIDFKSTLVDFQRKFKSLKIVPIKVGKSEDVSRNGNVSEENDESDADEDFVEVPEKEGLEQIAEADRHEYGLPPTCAVNQKLKATEKRQKPTRLDTIAWNPNSEPHIETAELADPCSRATAVAALARKQDKKAEQFSKRASATQSNKNPSDSGNNVGCSEPDAGKDTRKSELLKKAPVVPFGMDLYHWGSNEEEAPSVLNLKSLHCFWAHGNDNDGYCPGDLKESLKSRTIKFTGEFEEVKWACRAPLPSGKLCPRRDKFKCPFHGEIIARDETGRPDSEEHSDEVWSSENTGTTIEEMAAITQDIEQATGLNLTGKKQRKGTKRKHSGLTDLRKKDDTSRSRLAKKVFAKASLEHVAGEMDRVRKSLIDEKFGNNWNYSLSK